MDFKKSVQTWFKGNDFTLWRIKNAEDELVGKALEENTTADEGLALLSMNLEVLPTGLYKLYARKKKADSNGEVIYNFYVPETQNTIKVHQDEQLLARFQKIEAELEKSKKREEERKAEAEKEAFEEKIRKKYEKILEENAKPDILDRLTGVFGMLQANGLNLPFLPKQPGQPKGINGAPQQKDMNDSHEEEQNNHNEIIRTALGQMRRIFGDDVSFLSFLQQAGNIAENDPQKFSMLLNFMGQVKK